MIRGIFTPAGSPAVTGLLSFPRLGGESVDATFLLDTGATFSVIHPKDVKALGLDVMVAFGDRRQESGRGVGGRARYLMDEARLSFEHTDGEQFDYILPIHVAVPTDDNADYPSFLGMDFISNFRMVVSFNSRAVELQ